MRYNIISTGLILFLSLVYSTNASTPSVYKYNRASIEDKLRLLDVKANKKVINGLNSGIKSCYLLENLLLSVIMVESRFEYKAINKKSKDFGLMQININNVKKLKLDKTKLLTDTNYNIKHGCKILTWFIAKYGDDGIGRYNCGTKKGCIKYKSTKKYVKKVMGYKVMLDKLEKVK
jgi:soluble lytic murein transglycosylase-like protein